MKLESIAKGAQISGIEEGKVVRVVSADPLPAHDCPCPESHRPRSVP